MKTLHETNYHIIYYILYTFYQYMISLLVYNLLAPYNLFEDDSNSELLKRVKWIREKKVNERKPTDYARI